jgi:REP element-mobilizing transposase RayT
MKNKISDMEKLPDRKPNRLKKYDYLTPGYYFITMCVKDKQHIFGRVEDGVMKLSGSGLVADEQFRELSLFYRDVGIDYFVVMPNHVHAIIILTDKLQKKSIPDVVQAYKSLCSKKIREINNEFEWQRSYYDHIVISETCLENIRGYIKNNPVGWNKDAENTESGLDVEKYYEDLVKDDK